MRLTIFGIFFLLLSSIILQFSQIHFWNVPHFERITMYRISHLIPHENTGEEYCKIAGKNKMNEHTFQVVLTILGGFIAALVGLLTGWILNRRQRADEKAAVIENRRRGFLAAMNQIRHQASFVNYEKMGETYKSLLPLISYQAGLIRDDFSHVSKGFNDCLIGLYRLDETKINNPQNQADII